MTAAVVIGGGVVGVTSAYYLARAGVEVTLLEQGDIAAGSSYGNAGLLTPSDSVPLPAPGVLTKGLAWMLDPESPLYIPPRPDPALLSWLWRFRAAANTRTFEQHLPVLQRLSRLSLSLTRDLVREEALDCHFHEGGLLLLYRTASGFREGQHLAEYVRRFEIASEVWDADKVRARVPQVREDVVGGVYYRADAHVDPAAFVRQLAERLPRYNVRVQTRTEVLGFRLKGDRIVAVESTRGDFGGDVFVLAAGAWTALLARQVGLTLPIQPAKGYSITVRRPSEFPELPLILDEAKVAVTPMGDRLRFAGTLELAGHDLRINRRRVLAIRRAVGRYLALDPDAQPLVELWRGLRPCTPDGLPIIGWAPRPVNLIVAAGHCMLGMTQGAATGKLVADLVAGRTPDLDLEPFRVDRW